ncbi:receptor-like protein kinase FERONIA [Quercus robur]|uniref:receptor-like protein kinase FERONIA n=1 Tax=Quercus robur TaxID=38942 RepID=UPI002162FFDD|nr:receptor-like protein kinase FERONIA [Quercus robur]
MKSHPMLTPILYLCCLFFLLSYLTIATSTPLYNPVENIVVNCGSAGSLKGDDDRYWIGDKGSKFAPIEEPNHKSKTSEAQSLVSVETVPYMTARLSYWQFTYVFPVTPGPKFVRLYFYSAVYSGFESSKDIFTVKAGSFTLLRNFSASIYTDSLDRKDIYKEFCISVDENKKLYLTFIPFTSASTNYHAFINGIEIVSMPLDLYYKPFVPVVGQTYSIYIDYSRALEMVYRLNVGGGAIQAEEDTGMFRKWSEERDYLLSGRFGPHDPSLKPKYTKIPNYTAPDAVYQSAISMGPDSNKNRKSNLTWGLPVDTGFNFLVRLHFCEIESEIHASGTREFCIYIDDQLAEERADVLLWTDDNDTPYYKDYVVMIKNKGNDTHLLSIDLHSRLDAQLIDAILNGVEVFKLSDSDNNLARANIAASLLDQQPAGAANESKSKKTTIFIAIGSVLGLLVVLTLVCCMVLCKLKKTKHYGSCHPLAKRWWWSRPDPYKREFSRRARRLLGNEESHTPFPSDNLNQVQELPLFNFEMLVSATNDFHLSNKLGQGGFGPVYKGKLSDGQEIAVKRLSRTSAQGLKEFMNEVVIISKLQHRNLVRLLGCCVEGEERMLLYEYMPNKSLDAFLFGMEIVECRQRYSINKPNDI